MMAGEDWVARYQNDSEKIAALYDELTALRERCAELARDLRDSQINVDTLADELADMAEPTEAEVQVS